jgi:2-methylcitrate dehydratase PrpD
VSLTLALAERSREPADEPSLAYLRALSLTNVAAAIGTRGRFEDIAGRLPLDPLSVPGAAFIHAVHLHARTQDDFHPTGRVHVGAVALAATLALAEDAGDRLLDCVAAGYQAMCTLACVYAPAAQARGYRPTGIFGPVGAAASAAVALGLDIAGTANALGLAAARSGGTNQSWLSGTDEWLLEVGYAARSGVEAALLAQQDVKAAPEALEGRAGWARAFFDDEGAARLAAALEVKRSHLLDVAQKPYPVSGIAQVATSLACEAHAWNVAFPDEVEVRMSEGEAAYPGSANRGPFRSRSDALMSVAFCVACGLTDGTVQLGRLEAPHELEREASRVRVVPDRGLAEGTAILEMGPTGARRLTATAQDILYAGWEDEALSAGPLARRSEASEATVAAVRIELAQVRPDAVRLVGLLRSDR